MVVWVELERSVLQQGTVEVICGFGSVPQNSTNSPTASFWRECDIHVEKTGWSRIKP